MDQYTDSQMIMASQIAYLDFDESLMAEGPVTVGKILETQSENSTGTEKQFADFLLYRMENEPGAEVCKDWKIVNVRNDQHGSGMYACLLDTGEGNALLAFRGSESDTVENDVKDWGLSDLGLFNSTVTPQQAAASVYTQEMYREYGDTYSSFSFTGHSLGGNLAEHAALTAPSGMKAQTQQCVNLDGPGFSSAYIAAHSSEIAESSSVITHDQWSLVGALLTPIPGTLYRTVQADTPSSRSGMNALLWRHETTNVVYDSLGNFEAGSRDTLAQNAGPVTTWLDRLQFLLTRGNPLVTGAEAAEIIGSKIKGSPDEGVTGDEYTAGVSCPGAGELLLADSGVGAAAESIRESCGTVRQYAEELHGLPDGIPYYSAAAVGLKTSIRKAALQIESCCCAIREWAVAVSAAEQEIRSADRKAAAVFEGNE